MIATTSTTDRQPDLIIEFSRGDYSHALRCYASAKDWVVETGQAHREDLYGRILRPEHPQSPWEERIVPPDLVDDPNWTIRVELFAATEEILKWLQELPLPENATLTRVEAK